MLQSVIFDLDGLLIDSEIVAYRIYCDILRPYGYDFSLAHYAEKYSGRPVLRNMTDVIAEYGLPISVKEGLRLASEIDGEYIQRGIPLKKGALELLTFLKERGCLISLATSSLEERALTILGQNRVVEYFDTFTYAPEVTNGKPAPDIFFEGPQQNRYCGGGYSHYGGQRSRRTGRRRGAYTCGMRS